MTKTSGISGPVAAAGLTGAAESDSRGIYQKIQRNIQDIQTSPTTKIWGEKGKPF